MGEKISFSSKNVKMEMSKNMTGLPLTDAPSMRQRRSRMSAMLVPVHPFRPNVVRPKPPTQQLNPAFHVCTVDPGLMIELPEYGHWLIPHHSVPCGGGAPDSRDELI